jgi:hypothetical protein
MPTPADHPLLTAARDWFDAGFAVIPSHEDGGKRPFGPWKQYQAQRPTWADIEGWLITGRYTGIGVLTGRASGNVEMIEIEGPTEAAAVAIGRVKAKAEEMGYSDLINRTFGGCLSRSAGDGLHVFIRLTDGPAKGNTKLAIGADGQVIAETRGEGGFVIVAPTPGRKGHREGAVYAFIASSNPARTVDISSAERDQLHAVFTAALDEAPAALPAPSKPATTYDAPSPLDEYREHVTWRSILEPLGWRHSHHDGQRDHWIRPGKDPREGTSATTIEDGPLYCFSTNAGLPAEVGLSKAQVYAHLHHGGDLSAASRALRAAGYGEDVVAALAAWEPIAEPSAEQLDLHQMAVARKYAELRILEDARSLLAVAKAGQAPDLTGIALHDFLDQPDAPLRYRVDGLWPAEGRVLLAAAAKSGKTTLVAANLLPSLVDGRQFLGRHEAQPVTGTVVLLNMEVGENTLRRWLRDARMDNRHKVVVANLRGKASALTLATDKGRQRLADWLAAQRAEVVILDPLAPVLASLGLDENSNADVATFFSWWSEALSLAAVADDVVVHHTGHAGQRSRGASRLLDEPDAVWTLSREADEETGEFVALDPIRYLAAYGRDVEMPPEALAFDRATKGLRLTGKGKEEVKGDRKAAAVLAAFTGGPMSKSAIKKAVGGKAETVGYLIDQMVANGTLEAVSRSANGYQLLYPAGLMETS